MNREAIMKGLQVLLTNSNAFVTVSRRLKMWADVPESQRPAVFMSARSEDYNPVDEASPSKVTLNIDLIIYTNAKDQESTPSTTMNAVLDAVDTLLSPWSPAIPNQTLGNLVSHCWIGGKIMREDGDLDGDGVAVVPIKILVPN